MALKTTQTQLEEIQAAISQVMVGQVVKMGEKMLTLADLNALTARESILLARYKAEQGRGITINTGLLKRC